MKYRQRWGRIGLAGAILLGAAASAPAADIFVPGFTKFEAYTNITGVLVDDFRFHESYPDSPGETRYLPGIESPTGYGDNYGARISGFVVPPVSGNYVFYISSDDGGEFWLSTDESPDNLQFQAYEPVWNGPRNWGTPGSNATGRNPDAPENVSAPVPLVAGQRYYFEALVKEGTGGDNLAVTATLEGEPVPETGSPPLTGAWVGVMIPDTDAQIAFTEQPESVTVQANQDVTLTAQAEGSSPLGSDIVYQWYRDGQPLWGEFGPTLTLTRVQPSDDGAVFTVQASIPGAVATSAEAVLTVTPDVIPPTVVSVTSDGTFRRVRVTFSEPVSQSTATTAANYTLSGGATVNSVDMLDESTVQLNTSRLEEGTDYTLTISGVQDTYSPGNPIAEGTTVQFQSWTFYEGGVLNRFWDLTENSITALTNLANFPNNPDRVRIESAFEYPPDGASEGGSNYGNLMEAWWTAPATGFYIFFVNGDDFTHLYLSTDDDPANARLIALEPEWNNPRDWQGVDRRPGYENRSDYYPESQWNPPNTVTLTAGQRYYIRVLHTEGGGGDNVGVLYVPPGGAEPESGDPPIPGSELGFYYDASLSEAEITRQPQSHPVVEGRATVVSVEATGGWQWGDQPFFQWQAAPAGGGTFTNIPGATSATYTTPVLGPADSGVQYRVRVWVPSVDLTSEVATITVEEDQTPPAVVRVVAISPDAVTVTFDEPVDEETATQPGNYTLSGGLTFTAASLSSSNVVRLDTSGAITSGSQYTLTVSGVEDLYGNAASEQSVAFTARIITYADIILADEPIAYYRFEETSGNIARNEGTLGEQADGIWMSGDVEGEVRSAEGPGPDLGFGGFSRNNRAATFDGISDWIDTTQRMLDSLRAFTLEYWVRPNRTNEFGEVWMGGGAAGGSPDRVGIVGQNDAVEYGFITPTTIEIWTPGGGSLQTAYPFPDDEWHHVATIADGTTIRTYFDGVLINSGGTPLSATGNYGSADFNVHIGGGGITDATGNFFRGEIDEVAIFDKAIPAERIAAHYNAGRVGGVIEEEQPEFTSVSLVDGKLRLEWTGGGTLQQANEVTGPWEDVPNAQSPYDADTDEAAAFYRIVN